MSVVIIFNGQGAHYQEMGQDFVQNFPEARTVFEEAEAVTDYPIRQMITEDFDKLQETRYAQVAITATSLAIYRSIQEQLPAIDYMAGLSLGEYTSLIASQSLSFDEGFRLLKQRGYLMGKHCHILRDSSDIVMEAVLKMPLDEVKAVIDEVNQEQEQLYLANQNSSSQMIIAGPKEAISQFKQSAREQGYRKTMPLKVEGPFHSPYMEAVCQPYKETLAEVDFHEGEVPVISNTTVAPHSVDGVRELLVRHLVEPVRWQETIDYFGDHGVTKIIQIGPGKTLASLLKREANAPEALVVDKIADIDKIEDFIGG